MSLHATELSGQYRQGLRHGYGVYRFYTGDSYSGEWCNGQSHGVGLQTCSDASCYIGQIKYGVKHGLGCYHFRYVSMFLMLCLTAGCDCFFFFCMIV